MKKLLLKELLLRLLELKRLPLISAVQLVGHGLALSPVLSLCDCTA